VAHPVADGERFVDAAVGHQGVGVDEGKRHSLIGGHRRVRGQHHGVFGSLSGRLRTTQLAEGDGEPEVEVDLGTAFQSIPVDRLREIDHLRRPGRHRQLQRPERQQFLHRLRRSDGQGLVDHRL